MKIALVNPPFEIDDSVGKSRSIEKVLNIIPPLGLAYIAGYIEREGYEVKIYDATIGIGLSELMDSIIEFNPDIVGVTATTPSFKSANILASLLKEKKKSIKLIIGGAHVTSMPEHAIESHFDVGVIGEGEISFHNLLKHIQKNDLNSLDKIKGIIFKKGSEIIKTEKESFITNLDELPMPARHLLPPLSAYRPTPASYIKLPLAVIITSRGCPFKCTFCDRAIFGESFRMRSAENIYKEIDQVVNQYGAKEVRFFDDTFTLDKGRVYELCNIIIKEKIKIPWTCLTRVTAVDKPLLKTMKKAGCWQVLYGIESADDNILKKIKKGTTVEDNTNAIKWAKDAGLSVRCDFIVGLPGTTLNQMWKSVEFAKKMQVDYAHFNKFIPYPGTQLYKELVGVGHKFDFEEKSSILDHSALMYVPDGISKEQMKDFLDKSNKEFYIRISYMLKRLYSIRTFTELKGQVMGFLAIRGL